MTKMTSDGRTMNKKNGPLDKKYDAQIFITIGPVIKKDSVRDAVKFIQFNDFVNQLDFAEVSRIIKTRVLNEVIGPLNIKDIEGKTIDFEGAITFDRKDKIFITYKGACNS